MEVSTAVKLVQASELSSGDNATVVVVSKVVKVVVNNTSVVEGVVVLSSSTVLEVNPLSAAVLNLASESTLSSTTSSLPGHSGITSLRRK